jgi:hypothetical protein
MCIIADYVESVTETNIFVGILEQQKQLTIYSNRVKTSGPNTMVLPVPTNSPVSFVDLTHYKDLFKNLRNSFEAETPPGTEYYGLRNGGSDTVKVEKVGSYKASFVKDINSINNLDKTFGSFDKIMESLKKYYGSGFGFVVCQLIPGPEHEYHPFGYIHNMTSNELFVPTRHIHIHNENDQIDSKSEHYDHNIYSVDTTKKHFYHDNAIVGSSEWIQNDNFRDKYVSKRNDRFKITEKLETMINYKFNTLFRELKKLEIEGYFKNDDIVLNL